MKVLAGVIGALCGVIGFLPFYFVGENIKKLFVSQDKKSFKYVLLTPLVSFVLMIVAMLICGLVARQYLMVFGIACIAVFFVCITVFVVLRLRKQ